MVWRLQGGGSQTIREVVGPRHGDLRLRDGQGQLISKNN